MRALDRKLWRDLWHMRGQAVAIALLLAGAWLSVRASRASSSALSMGRRLTALM